MYLKKLELHGFKSFAQPTALDFDSGVTCIVGPNGCGKSNIVDAVRWVVGEQRARALRSEKMENVIFNGTSKRRALGMAEVLLTVENTRGVLPVEYSEVTLGRRLYRSGESEYLLNGVACRLRDIQDLFMDTGMGAGAYSVIELSMVEEILSENADDRRRLFEEAAGITRYKLRRKQALGRLEGTQHDLTRLRDLTDEIGANVRTLKRQADRAALFRELESRRVALERGLLVAEYSRLDGERAVLDGERHQLADRLEAHAAAIARREAEGEALGAHRIALEADRRAAQEALHAYRARVQALEAEGRVVQERLARLDDEQKRLYAELAEGAARQKAQEHVRARFEDELARAEPRHAGAQHALARASDARDAARQALETARAATQQARRDEAAAERTAADARRAADRLQARAELVAAEAARLARPAAPPKDTPDVEGEEQARAGAEQQLQQAQQALGELERQRARLEEQRRETADARRDVESRQAALAAEKRLLAALVGQFEGFSDAVRALARHRPDLTTAADVLRADAGWERALDAALGDWAGCVLVETDTEADALLAWLREQNAGQVLLLVLEKLGASSGERDDTALAARVQPTAPRYAPVRDALLGGWHTAASLDEALRQARGAGRWTTPDGFWADGEGRRRGGSALAGAPAPSRAAQRERLASVETALAQTDRDLDGLRARETALAAQMRALDFASARQALDAATRALRDHDARVARARADADAARRQAEEHARRRAALEEEQRQIAPQLADAEARDAAARDAWQALRSRREKAESAADALEKDSRSVFEQYNAAALAEADARNRAATLRADTARTRQTLADMDAQARQREARYAETDRARDAARADETRLARALETAGEKRQPLEDAAAAAETALAEVQAALSEAERDLRDARGRREALARQAAELDVRRAQVETRLAALAEDHLQLFDAPIEQADEPVPDDFDAVAARDEVQALRRRIAALGSVNALALESYDAEKTRLDFLIAQQRDLENAETSLLATIGEINTAAAQRFRETFAQIEASFVALFRELFGPEARAELRLDGAADPLESAVEIFAQPGGKRPSALAQLSGGEKTLTAIALLFSIYLVKPSPFCILDEVDAPLDEANVDRYMHLIRRFSDKTQFLLVTHNKRTMELADRLYGVTMQEPGVSKTVTVRFEDAAASAA